MNWTGVLDVLSCGVVVDGDCGERKIMGAELEV